MAEVIELSSDEESGASNSKQKILTTFHDWNRPSTSTASDNLQPANSILESETFQHVTETCKKCIGQDADGLKILSQVKKQYSKMDEDAKNSDSFKSFLLNITSRIASNPGNVYVYIKDLHDEIKLNIYMPRKRNNFNNASTSSNPRETNNSEEKVENSKRESRIRYLEKLLGILSSKIKKLEEKELSLDDMEKEDSRYILEDKYKKRIVQVWKKLCELNNSPTITGRWSEKKVRYKGSRYEAINIKVTKYINRHKEVPEFAEILELVNIINKDCNLLVNAHDEAKKVFTEVVEMLRERRLLDFEEGLDVSDAAPDPANKDEELANSLEESRKLRIKRTDEIINEFAEKQSEAETRRGKDKIDSAENGETEMEEDKTIESHEGHSNGTNDDKVDESDDENDEEEEEDKEVDIGEITEEFQDELESEEIEERHKVVDSESEDESDSSNDETEQIDDCSNNSEGSGVLKNCFIHLPTSMDTLSLENKKLKRPPTSSSEDTPIAKRLCVSPSIFEDDDIIVLD